MFAWDLARGLSEVGVEPTLIAPRGSLRPQKGYLVETIDPPNRFTGNEEELAYNIYKGRLGEFDLINDHTHQKWVYIYKLEHPETRIIGTIHGIQTWGSLPPVRWPNIVGISEWQLGDMERRYGYRPLKVNLCIDVDSYPFREEKGKRLLSMGLMARNKGHHLSVLLAKKIGLPLDVAGETEFGVDPAYVDRVMSSCAGDIKFFGRVSTEDKLRILSEAKGLLLPFLQEEAWSLLALEALACGTPVITTNLGAMPEIIEDGVNGFICEYGSRPWEHSFMDAINRLDDIDPRECRRSVEGRFSIPVIASQYRALYEEVLKGREW